MKTYWWCGVVWSDLVWRGVMKTSIDDSKAQDDVTSLLHTVSGWSTKLHAENTTGLSTSC